MANIKTRSVLEAEVDGVIFRRAPGDAGDEISIAVDYEDNELLTVAVDDFITILENLGFRVTDTKAEQRL